MLESIKQRLGRDDEQGFTLIELMVVVLIIAILLAIAIPTFLGARNSANARSSQSNLRNSLTAEQSFWTNNQAFSSVVSDLQGIEPQINWQSGGAITTQGGNTVAMATGVNTGTTADTVVLYAYAKDGNCYLIEQTNDPGVTGAGAAGAHTGYAINKKASCAAVTLDATGTQKAFITVLGGPASAGTQDGAHWYQTW